MMADIMIPIITEPPYFSPDGDLYIEDFILDRAFIFGHKKIGKDEIISFASQFDAQPFHLSVEAGEASMLGGLSASGWHSCVLLEQMAMESFLHRVQKAGPGTIEKVAWRRPVLMDDELTATVCATHIDLDYSDTLKSGEPKCDDRYGLCHLHYDMFKQGHELVLQKQEVLKIRLRDAVPEGAV